MAKKKPEFHFRTAIILILTVFVAAMYRFWGLKWGLPNALHNYSYHPDEVFQVGAMAILNPLRFMFDPQFYSYPSGYMNLGAVVLRVLDGWGVAVGESQAFLVARIITAVMGVLTVPLVYSAGKKLFNRSTGIIAAVVFAVMPLHIVHSHFATVDVTATLWVTAALVGASLILIRPSVKAYLIAGLCAGIAAGTKYNAAIVILPVLVAHFVREDDASVLQRLRKKGLWFSILGAVVGFIAATPGILVKPAEYFNGFNYERSHVATGHGLVFVGKGPGWLDVLSSGFGYGLGVLLLVMTIFAMGSAIARHKRQDWVLLSFIVPSFLIIAFSEVRFARYVIPMLPAVTILIARLMDETYTILVEQRTTFLRCTWVLICAGIISYTAIYAVAFDKLFTAADPRDQAAEWFEKNVPRGTTLGLPTVPWFYSVPLCPGSMVAFSKEDRYKTLSESKYRLITNSNLEFDTDLLKEELPKYVVVSDYESYDPLRLKVKAAEDYFGMLFNDYKKVKVFDNRLYAFGIDFGASDQLPHDLKYMAPTITVYRKQ